MEETSAAGPIDEGKLIGILCHLSLFLGLGFFLPLIVVFVTHKQPDSYTARHAREALNFHLSVAIYAVIGAALYAYLYRNPELAVYGLGIIALAVLAAGLYTSIACWMAARGEFFHYPLTVRLI